jgi:transposase
MRAMAKKIRWLEAAEILGISCRRMRRWKGRWDEHGDDGLFDRRCGKLSPKTSGREHGGGSAAFAIRRSIKTSTWSHFHGKVKREHQIKLSYIWVKTALQTAGLVRRRGKRSKHRKRRAPRPLPGMMLHIDGSKHKWFGDGCYYDLLVVLDDATKEIYYAQLVDAESTFTVVAALREVVEQKGLFCSVYCDRASHFFLTPKPGEPMAELPLGSYPLIHPRRRGRGAELSHLARTAYRKSYECAESRP